ncbi:MAG: ATP-binding protein [Chloroflexales bacterium]|nr:ATP-binding protein [Chloroflexales bacterium]
MTTNEQRATVDLSNLGSQPNHLWIFGRWSLVGMVGLVVAFAIAILLAIGMLGAPQADILDLLIYLGFSTGLSLLLLLPTFFWLRYGRGRLMFKLLFTYILGLVIFAINIIVAAQRMFISEHDRELLLLLLAFTAVVMFTLGIALANLMSTSITRLRDCAHALAAGNLDIRVAVRGGGELADLANDFNQLAAQLAAAANERKQMEENRRELFAAISHDLRTPLASLRALTEALDDGVVSDPSMTQRYLTTMHNQIQHLNRLIDDLFELAQLDSGVLRLELEHASLQDLVSDTLEAMGAQARQKEIRLSGEVAPSIDTVLMAPPKIERVLYNLVSNAIRHTPAHGAVAISVRTGVELNGDAPADQGAASNTILIEVIDTGEGIDPQDLPRIFEIFYRGEKSRSRATGGAGLGLAIARRIVEAHGGTIWMTSERGIGSRVSFTLPQGTDNRIR